MSNKMDAGAVEIFSTINSSFAVRAIRVSRRTTIVFVCLMLFTGCASRRRKAVQRFQRTPQGPKRSLFAKGVEARWAEMNERTFSELKRIESSNSMDLNVLVSGVATDFIYSLRHEVCGASQGARFRSSAQLIAAQRSSLPAWYSQKLKVGITSSASGLLPWAKASQGRGSLRNAGEICFNGQPLSPGTPGPGSSALSCDWETPDSLMELGSVDSDIEVSLEVSTDIVPLIPVNRKRLFMRSFKVRSDRSFVSPTFRALYENILSARSERLKYTVSVLPTSNSDTVAVFLSPDEVDALQELLEDLSWREISEVLHNLTMVEFSIFSVPKMRFSSGSSKSYEPNEGAFKDGGKICGSAEGSSGDLRLRVNQELSISIGHSSAQASQSRVDAVRGKRKVYNFDWNFPRQAVFLGHPFLIFLIDKSTGAVLTAAAVHDPSNRAAISVPSR